MGLGKAFSRSAENGMPHAGPPYGWGWEEPGLRNLLVSTGGMPWEVSGTTGMQHYRGAMRIPAAWRGSNLLAGLLARVCWDAYTTHGRDQEELIVPRPALLEQPSPPDTRFTTLHSAMLDKVWHGNSVWIVATRDSNGIPTSVWPTSASGVGIRRITPENMYDSNLPVGRVEYQIGTKRYDQSDIIHVKGPCSPGALRGMGVLEAHFYGVLLTAHEQQREARNAAKPEIPEGLMKVNTESRDFEEDDPDHPFKNEMEYMRGVHREWKRQRREGGISVVNSAVDFVPLAWNPDERQMIQGRQFTLLEMALILGLPPKFLGASTGDSMTYSTSETEGRELLRFTMGEHFEQFEQTLSLVFPRGTCVKADLDTFLESDALQRAMFYASARSAGWMLNSEIRARENLPPIAGIDEAPDILPLAGKLGYGIEPGQLGAHQPPALPPGQQQDQQPAVRAAAWRRDEMFRISALLDTPQGRQLWHYWMNDPEGSKWKFSTTPWETLNHALKIHAVAKGDLPAYAVDGLTNNLYVAAFGHEPPHHQQGGKHRG